MKLHLDTNAFRVLIQNVHERSGIRSDVLEKDYYVVLILYELAGLQKEGLKAYFKGGTALYKALKTPNRFSEDIDLSVDVGGCNRTQSEKQLASASKKYTSLKRDADSPFAFTHRSEVVAVYQYEPLAKTDAGDALQRFGNVKVEATSFTISEPFEDLQITPLLFTYATPEEKEVLETQYEIVPFTVKTMTLERIFIDKLFAAEAYTAKSSENNRAFEAAKHIYDLSVLESDPRITNLFNSEERLSYLLGIRLREEIQRLDGIPYVAPSDFSFFEKARSDRNVKSAYEVMQKQYVLKDEDRIAYDRAMDCVHRIGECLRKNPAWNAARPPEKPKDNG